MPSATSIATATTTTANATSTPAPGAFAASSHYRSRATPRRSIRLPSSSVSTPNLNSAYQHSAAVASSSSSTTGLSLAPSALSRKTSFAALTHSSLASIPDVSESYAFDSVLSDSTNTMSLATPGRPSGDDVAMGDTVDVPGGMQGTVRFVGQVQGKKGVFAGVELLSPFASKGKNNGDVDG